MFLNRNRHMLHVFWPNLSCSKSIASRSIEHDLQFIFVTQKRPYKKEGLIVKVSNKEETHGD